MTTLYEQNRRNSEHYADDPDDAGPETYRRLPDPVELDAFLQADEPDHEWLVEGLLERGDRTIVTGPEGGGKSTLLRQMGLQMASGIHPFTLEGIDPLSVLLVDCENSGRQIRRKMRDLRTLAPGYLTGSMHVVAVGNAVNIGAHIVEMEIAEIIEAVAVDVLIIGPLYKMATGDPIKEEPAKATADALDRLRAIRGSALLIEAHTPYADSSRNRRPQRPYGASLWSRWPEFGIYLDPLGKLDHWRGQRDERTWPASLKRGPSWPWAIDQPAAAADEPWKPTDCIASVVAVLDELPGQYLSGSKVAELLKEGGSGFRRTTIYDALRIAADDGRLTSRRHQRGHTEYATAGGELGDF